MSRFLPAVLVLLLAAPAFAQDKPKPNTLTPKESAEGWLLLFDGESTFGWKVEGAAEVKDGVLILGKGKKTIAYPTTNFAAYQVFFKWSGNASVFFSDHKLTLSNLNRVGTCQLIRGEGTTGFFGSQSKKELVQKPRSELNATPFVIETDGVSEVQITDVQLRPLEAKPLFNGKDLAGWKVFDDPKRAATKFEVTKDGELSAKNGPGDLQTEKAFDNFVLQLECKTNGKWLNSGVFFRCIPNQYQNGYECQIQNAFNGEDRTKPVDFGTGAIYRRIAARKVVSNDNEWFTLTVVADGKHFSTWVNGYQTVDWTDDRPANDNPRQGFRAEKGHISIQGHDPTTDLLFRNIRIVELVGK